MSLIIKLSALETAIIKSWYEYAYNDYSLCCGAEPMLPSEQALLQKLENHLSGSVLLTETELEIICGWMERAVEGKYGSVERLFGYELRAYKKLKSREGILL